MKPVFARVPEISDHDLFATREINLPYFSTEFHFHRECQMVYILEGEGKRIIGDSIETFSNDELIFLGPDIPHVWHNENHYFQNPPDAVAARSVAIFFDPEKLINTLKHFGEVKDVETFLALSRRGIIFSGDAKLQLKDLMTEIFKHEGIGRLRVLLDILELMSTTKEYKTITAEEYVNTYHHRDNDRIDKVFKYIFTHFERDIQLEEVANIANMNKQAFCRYFKTRTKKTFIEFVNSVRVNHACKIMQTTNTAISALAYKCGFNSLSNFNRFFKEVTGVTPREYRKRLEISQA